MGAFFILIAGLFWPPLLAVPAFNHVVGITVLYCLHHPIELDGFGDRVRG
jgi:hypothetical protein